MLNMNIKEPESLLPSNVELEQFEKITNPVEQIEFLTQLFPHLSLVKNVTVFLQLKAISIDEMAVILHKRGYSLKVSAGALRTVYTELSNRTIIAALAAPKAYQSEGRTKMIIAAQWAGTTEDPGMNLSSFESSDAVLPSYPEFNVLNYQDDKHGTLSTEVAVSPNEFGFFYKNTYINEKWSLSRTQCNEIYQSDDISVTTNSDTAGRGLFRVGNYKNWYYDLSLFASPDDLHQQILGFVANVCGMSACTTEVEAREKWKKTGFMVGKDQNVHINYISGQWTANPGQQGLHGPEGINISAKQGYALPGANEGCLVGRINDHTFYIGTELKLPPGMEGELELTINDDVDSCYGAGYTDNQGVLTIMISRDSTL